MPNESSPKEGHSRKEDIESVFHSKKEGTDHVLGHDGITLAEEKENANKRMREESTSPDNKQSKKTCTGVENRTMKSITDTIMDLDGLVGTKYTNTAREIKIKIARYPNITVEARKSENKTRMGGDNKDATRKVKQHRNCKKKAGRQATKGIKGVQV